MKQFNWQNSPKPLLVTVVSPNGAHQTSHEATERKLTKISRYLPHSGMRISFALWGNGLGRAQYFQPHWAKQLQIFVSFLTASS